jgi:uncharacterized glyoxalase superfamily metalloenzyme YdcJ
MSRLREERSAAMSRLREERRAPSHRVETWQLRAKFAAALSQVYGADVPAYTTLVEVCVEVNRDFATDEEMAASGLAYYHDGNPAKPVVYEDFLPASAAGIFRSNLDTDTLAAEAADNLEYSMHWLAGQIGHHIHDPYELYEKVAA